jgi:hypothetical protein
MDEGLATQAVRHALALGRGHFLLSNEEDRLCRRRH